MGDRLTSTGISYLSWMNCELFLAKYKQHSPVEDVVKALCRGAYIVSDANMNESLFSNSCNSGIHERSL